MKKVLGELSNEQFLLLPSSTRAERVYTFLRYGTQRWRYVVAELEDGHYAVFKPEEFLREWEEYRKRLSSPASDALITDIPQFTATRVAHTTSSLLDVLADTGAQASGGEQHFVILRGAMVEGLVIKRLEDQSPRFEFINHYVQLDLPYLFEYPDRQFETDGSIKFGHITMAADGTIETTFEGLKSGGPGWRDVHVRAGESMRVYHRLTDEETHQRLGVRPKNELIRLLLRGQHAGFVNILEGEGEGEFELGIDLRRAAQLSGVDEPFCHQCGSNLVKVSQNADKVVLTSTSFRAPRERTTLNVDESTRRGGADRGVGADQSKGVIPEVAPEISSSRDAHSKARPEIAPELRPRMLPEIAPEVAPEIRPEIAPEVRPEIRPEVRPEIAPELVPEDSPESEREEVAEPAQRRWINVTLEGDDAAKMLQVEEVYTLSFDVDVMVRLNSIVKGVDFGYVYREGEEGVELEIHLSSQDFRIYDDRQKLYVPRTGRSENKARFDIKPLHDGTGTLKALILKDNNFIQELTLTLEVGRERGGSVKVESKGRPPEAAVFVKPRDVHIDITRDTNGFELKFISGVSTNTILKFLTPEAVDEMSKDVRTAWEKIIKSKSKQGLVYQTGVDIPAAIGKTSLKNLAREGYLLYQNIFYENQDKQTQAIGDHLRKFAREESLHIQITSDGFFLPWSVLYMAPNLDVLEPEMFLGLKHVIEHIPKQEDFTYFDLRMDGSPKFSVSLNIDEGIDEEAAAKGIKRVVEEQVEFWNQLKETGNVAPVVRRKSDDLLKVLGNNSLDERLIYFYCHAGSRQGANPPYIKLSDGKRLGLKDFIVAEKGVMSLPNAPLVFINACESAELSPFFYNDFLNHFVSKGARGVIGTECKIPAVFASEWAKRFFTRFLPGKPLGELLLELRREFFFEHNNLLGLAYALYCDADTQILPGLQVNEDSPAPSETKPSHP